MRLKQGHRIVGALCQRWFGTTYQGKSPEGEECLVHVLSVEPTEDRWKALQQRAHLLRKMAPGCLSWLDWGKWFNRSFYVVEKPGGQSLEGAVFQKDELRKVAAGLLKTLAQLHEKGLVHGALCPEFLFRPTPDQFQLGGLYAFAASPGCLEGKFTAPEMRLGMPRSPSGDIYSAGAILSALAGIDPSQRTAQEQLDSLLGLGRLLSLDPDIRPSAKTAWSSLQGRASGPSPAESSQAVGFALSWLAKEKAPLAFVGQDARFALQAVASSLASHKVIHLSADRYGTAPFGVVKAMLPPWERYGHTGKKASYAFLREDLEKKISDTSAQNPWVAVVFGFDRADFPSQRLLLDLARQRDDFILLLSCQHLETWWKVQAKEIREPWRWRTRIPALEKDRGRDLEKALPALFNRLPSPELDLLRILSLGSAPHSLEELLAVLQAANRNGGDSWERPPAEAVRELLRQGLLVCESAPDTGAESYAILHPRLIDLIKQNVPEEELRRLHGTLAFLLEIGALGDDNPPFSLNEHLLQAGEVRPELLSEVILGMASAGDLEKARALIADHSRELGTLNGERRLELLESAELFEKATDLCSELLDRAAQAEIAPLRLRLGQVFFRQSLFDNAHSELSQAWRSRDNLTGRQILALALDLVQVCCQQSRLAEASKWLSSATTALGTHADAVAMTRFMSIQADLERRLGKGTKGVEKLKNTLKSLSSDDPQQVSLLTKLGELEIARDAYDDALESHRRALELALRQGLRTHAAQARFNLARVLFLMEQIEAARSELEELLRQPLASSFRARTMGLMGTIYGDEGRLVEARKWFLRARENLDAREISIHCQIGLDEALLLADHGLPEAAKKILEGLEAPRSGFRREAYLSTSALAEVMEGKLDVAAGILESLDSPVDPVYWEALGLLDLKRGDPAKAVLSFQEGLKLTGPLNSSYRRGLLMVHQAKAVLRCGRRRRAVNVLQKGFELLARAPLLVASLQDGLDPALNLDAQELGPVVFLEALVGLGELLKKTWEPNAVQRWVVDGLEELPGVEEVHLTLLDPVTAEVLSGPAAPPISIDVTELGRVPRRCESVSKHTWICGLLEGHVPLGYLFLRGRYSFGDGFSDFFGTYSAFAATALLRARDADSGRSPSWNSSEANEDFLPGRSEAMRRVLELAEVLARSDDHVLLLGESGVGKSHLARKIHEMSRRKSGKFLQVDLASEPKELVSSILFGHEKGAFTGAAERKEGFIAAAEGGTLFLDEIGDIGPEVQQKLLVFLQNKSYHMVGSTARKQANVRVILATNRDLAKESSMGRFRKDLYYRLSGLLLKVPPLRERRTDIPAYSQFFFREVCRAEGRQLRGISAAAVARMAGYSWPGNLRELRNCLHRAVLVAPRKGWIEPEHLFQDQEVFAPGVQPRSTSLREAREALDKRMIWEALRKEGNNRSRTARRLGITRQGLLGMMKRYDIDGLQEGKEP